MQKITISVPVPKIIMSVVLWFVLRYRKRQYGYTFRRIKLSKDKYSIVDVEDYGKLSQYDWHLYGNESKNYYAARFDGGKIVKMHRQILNAPPGSIVDHRYGNGLDNRKENLRIATISQNLYNRRKTSKKTTSKYKGVHLKRESNKYAATISCNGKRIFLGYFENEIDAAKAYDNAAMLYHKEFARLNFG